MNTLTLFLPSQVLGSEEDGLAGGITAASRRGQLTYYLAKAHRFFCEPDKDNIVWRWVLIARHEGDALPGFGTGLPLENLTWWATICLYIPR